MPLPHFLFLVGSVILAGAITIWLAASAGVPMPVLGLGALMAAGLLHLSMRDHKG